MKKKHFLSIPEDITITLIVIMIGVLGVFVYAQLSYRLDVNGYVYNIPPGVTAYVLGPDNSCKSVTNKSSTNNLLVPEGSSAHAIDEWNAFLANSAPVATVVTAPEVTWTGGLVGTCTLGTWKVKTFFTNPTNANASFTLQTDQETGTGGPGKALTAFTVNSGANNQEVDLESVHNPGPLSDANFCQTALARNDTLVYSYHTACGLPDDAGFYSIEFNR